MTYRVPDWGKIIADLQAAGLTSGDIAREIGMSMVTDRMIRQYAAGVQPLYHRGDRLLNFWMVRLERKAADVPMTAMIRGHRVARRPSSMGPTFTNIPQWPVRQVEPQPAVSVIKQRKPRKEKVEA